ncbi:MAG: MazG nucleotide pyrophosphohydrolase domain-containing protein [Candidatus Omnitrophota bacterium]
MKEFDRLIKTIRILRSPGGCPWDRAQRLRDYKKYLLEEAYELIEELNENKFDAVEEELGDLFLILIIMSEMLRERGYTSVQNVLSRINEKLIERHPHVFAHAKLKNKDEVLRFWIRHKAKKKNRKTIKDRLPKTAPALFLADLFLKEHEKIQNNTSSVARGEADHLSAIKVHQEALYSKRNREKHMVEIILSLTQLSRLWKRDLENDVRRAVMRRAAAARYGRLHK